MSKPQMTTELARAAATDAGNRSMRAAGRSKWNQDDAIAAHREFSRLNPAVNILPADFARAEKKSS